jgi:two-component system chemotaxis response regulator CheB
MAISATPPNGGSGYSTVIIGASTGGGRAMCALLDELPLVNAAIVLVQHLPEYIQESFIRTLRLHTPFQVQLATEGAPLRPGSLLLAPAGRHLILDSRQQVRLAAGPPVHYVCPSVDVTMKSVSPLPRQSVIGVLLTGMGKDGAGGLLHLRRQGARTIAQDQASSAVFGMPKAAWDAGAAEFLLPPAQIARKIAQWAGPFRAARPPL